MTECLKISQNSQTTISTDASQDNQPFIGHYDAAPLYMKENDKIHTGYRINFQSKWRLFKTLFMVHNQSINIWTHLLPFLVFICVLVSFSMKMDDVDFKRTVSQSRQQIDRVYRQYEMTIGNVTLTQKSFYGLSTDTCPGPETYNNSLFQKYMTVLHKVSLQTKYLHDVLSQDIEGIGHKFKNQVKQKLKKMEEFMDHYENHILPELMHKIDKKINSSFVSKVKNHAQSLKQYLDSQLFEMIELHPQTPNPELVSRWPLFVFITTAVLCLLFSSIFHLFYPLSRKAFGLLLRFDFAGISLLIAGSAYPTFYYSFYCHFAAVEFYLTITSILAFACFVIGLFEWIHLHQNAKYRGILFGAFGLSMIIPLSHLVINQFFFDNFGDPYRFSSSYFYYGIFISSYIIGLYIFIVRWPECKNPGKYDICGHSHQIWHCLVVIGIVFTYYGCLNNYQMRKEAACPVQTYI